MAPSKMAAALAAVLLTSTTLAALAAASFVAPPNSSAALFKNETEEALLALRAHAAGLAATILPDKKAAALSKPRLLGYPKGVCNATCSDKQKCPNRTCDEGVCPSYSYEDARASRDSTPCLSNFPTTCADPANSNCFSCALWQEIQYRCAPMGVSSMGCVSRGDYVIMPSREVKDVGNNVTKLCATTPVHYLLLPTRPCVGVESSDPLCTGSKADYWWGAAFDEAVLYGVAPGPMGFKPPSPPKTTMRIWGRDVPVAPGTSSWGVQINAPNRRSQHQTHIRIARWQPGMEEGEDYWAEYGGIFPEWLAVETFSVDKLEPTLTGPAAPILVNGTNITQWPQLATVFIPTPLAGKPDAYKVEVWETASKIATVVNKGADRPYGILIAPRWQAALGPKLGGPVVPGVSVTAVFEIGAGQMLDETPNLSDCVGLCEVWRPVNVTVPGARPPPLKSWAAAKPRPASDADETTDCEIPPKPAHFPGSQREWYEHIGLSW